MPLTKAEAGGTAVIRKKCIFGSTSYLYAGGDAKMTEDKYANTAVNIDFLRQKVSCS